jgi:hypothetical protein
MDLGYLSSPKIYESSHTCYNKSLVDKIKSLESELDMSRTKLERLSSVKLGEVLDYDKPSFNKYGFGYIDVYRII